ncbi:MAG: acetate kinase [Planctomycetota bacterium]|nr:MAG: acetate kinase [Planctomycetota bacterium]
MNVLVLNAGSSSLRFQLIETDYERMRSDEDLRHADGRVERIGTLAMVTLHAAGQKRVCKEVPLRDHAAAIDYVLRWLVSPESGIESLRSISDIHAVGHRMVHGGQSFRESVLIDPEVLRGLEDCVDLAPLHMPGNLSGVRAVEELLGQVPQVAVFDTAFHSTMPATSYLYALPYHYYSRFGVRRYGFHGTSHRYVAFRYRQLMKKPRKDVNIITLHLGNGSSACAIRDGDSFDTSMGFTPLEGLMMGTRTGDIDPSVMHYLSYKEGLGFSELDTMLSKHSGLLGISGLASDMRELLKEESEHFDRRVTLAIDMFCARVRKYIGAYYVGLEGCEALVFAGGIGENSPEIRARICKGLDCLGLKIDEERNREAVGGRTLKISTEDSTLAAWVIPTDEELMIARDTVRAVEPEGQGT